VAPRDVASRHGGRVRVLPVADGGVSPAGYDAIGLRGGGQGHQRRGPSLIRTRELRRAREPRWTGRSSSYGLAPRRSVVLSMVKLRRATAEDVPGIVALAASTFGAGDPENIEDRLFRWSVDKGFSARISGDWDDRDHCVFVATNDSENELVGLIEVSMQPQSGQTAPPFPVPAFLKRLSIRPLFPYISNLVIADKERRKGYAKRLVRACEQQARGWGYDRCYLHVDLDYPPAAALYEGMGYGVVREDPSWMKTVNGVALRYMSKALK